MKTANVQKTITFPTEIYDLVVSKAKQLGLSFSDYVKHLVITDVKDDIEPLEMVDAETEKRIGESLKALKEGKYTDIDVSNEEELNKFLGIK